jgi:hypothetical protein
VCRRRRDGGTGSGSVGVLMGVKEEDGGTGSGSVDGCVEGEEVGALGVEGLEV